MDKIKVEERFLTMRGTKLDQADASGILVLKDKKGNPVILEDNEVVISSFVIAKGKFDSLLRVDIFFHDTDSLDDPVLLASDINVNNLSESNTIYFANRGQFDTKLSKVIFKLILKNAQVTDKKAEIIVVAKVQKIKIPD